jgi:hypothetical protein
VRRPLQRSRRPSGEGFYPSETSFFTSRALDGKNPIRMEKTLQQGFYSAAEWVAKNPRVFTHPWGARGVFTHPRGVSTYPKQGFLYPGGFYPSKTGFLPIRRNIVRAAGFLPIQNKVFTHPRRSTRPPTPTHPHKAPSGRPRERKGQTWTPKHPQQRPQSQTLRSA